MSDSSSNSGSGAGSGTGRASGGAGRGTGRASGAAGRGTGRASGAAGRGCTGAIISISHDCDGNPLTKEEKQAKLMAIYKSEGWRELKEEIIKYNEIREKVVNDMENHPDPIFQDFLQFYKCTLGPEVFQRNRLKVYAICNKQAMCRMIPIDEIVKHNHIAIETNNTRVSYTSSSEGEDD